MIRAKRGWQGPAGRRASITALAASVALLAAGCTAEGWPRVRAVGDPAFLRQARTIETVDLLPVDFQVWTEPDHARDATAVAGELDPTLGGVVAAELLRRGYGVQAQIGWDGRYVAPDGLLRRAMTADAVDQTAYALSTYGRAQIEVGDGLLVPYLPARLGAATGSDATLYVGGWAFAGHAGPSKGAKIARTILIIALVAIVVVVVIAGAKGGGKGAGAVGKAAAGAGRAAGTAVKVAGRALGGIAHGVTRMAGRTASVILHDGELFARSMDAIDAFARMGTHIEIDASRPVYYQEGPHRGRSAMLIEMTLVDNHTGRTLWHARQRFPANPERPAEVQRAVAGLLRTLPGSR